jgi:hypothetical protein
MKGANILHTFTCPATMFMLVSNAPWNLDACCLLVFSLSQIREQNDKVSNNPNLKGVHSSYSGPFCD